MTTADGSWVTGAGRCWSRSLWALWVAVMIAFSAFPIGSRFFAAAGENKDYDIWFNTGRQVLHGGDLYSNSSATHFEFSYPPPAALFLAPLTLAGEVPFLVALVVLNSAAWVVCVALSVFLVAGHAWQRHSLLSMVPVAASAAYVYDTYLLGQPNLVLLALLLGAFICLEQKHEAAAGALVALAAAIKAFPIMAVGYLVYRRHWKATLSLVASLVFLLVLLPAPFRGFDRNLAELSTWTQGMLFKYDRGMIAQRPGYSFYWKNHSLIAISNRLLRHVPADLTQVRDGDSVVRDEPVYINVADLDFRTVNIVIVGVGLGLCLGYVAVMPAYARRTGESNAIELAMLLILIVIFSPISRFYYGVWLLYPFMVVVQFIQTARTGSCERTMAAVWLGASLLLLNFVFPWDWLRPVRAIGLPFFGYLLLLGELAWILRREQRTVGQVFQPARMS